MDKKEQNETREDDRQGADAGTAGAGDSGGRGGVNSPRRRGGTAN